MMRAVARCSSCIYFARSEYPVQGVANPMTCVAPHVVRNIVKERPATVEGIAVEVDRGYGLLVDRDYGCINHKLGSPRW